VLRIMRADFLKIFINFTFPIYINVPAGDTGRISVIVKDIINTSYQSFRSIGKTKRNIMMSLFVDVMRISITRNRQYPSARADKPIGSYYFALSRKEHLLYF